MPAFIISFHDRRSESLSLNLDQIFVCVFVSVSDPPQITEKFDVFAAFICSSTYTVQTF